MGKLGKRDVGTAIVENKQNFPVCHAKIKCFEPLEEDDLCHPSLRIVTIGTAKVIHVDVFETTRTFVLADDPERKLVGAIAIAADSQSETLLVLLFPFQLLCCQGIVRLKNIAINTVFHAK